MATSTRTRPATRSRTVRYAPAVSGSSPAGFGSPRPSSAAARARAGGRTQQGSNRDPLNAPLPPRLPAVQSGQRGRQASPSFRPRARPYGQAQLPDTNYAGVILAEFVGVILVIALAPVAKGESTSGVSPYAGGDMVKLAAATLLYVILGFVAVGGRGAARVAAWLGGLALIAVGLAEGTALAQEVGLFTGSLLAASQGPSPSGAGPTAQQQQIIQGVGPAALNLPAAVVESAGPVFGPGQETAPL